jgi:hybrid cluster-associated redox disulfide protein
MKKIVPTPDLTVDKVMCRWPATIRVFIDFKMHCVGCPIATFHSVDEASREHKIDAVALLDALQLVTAREDGV